MSIVYLIQLLPRLIRLMQFDDTNILSVIPYVKRKHVWLRGLILALPL